MVVFVGLVVVIHSLGGAASLRLEAYMKHSLKAMSSTALTPHVLFTKSVEFGVVLFQVVGPFVLTALLLGVIANVLQTGFLVSTQSLVPDFNRINPLNGAKRFISSRGLMEVTKSVGKLGIIGWIGYSTVSNGYPEILAATRREPQYITSQIGDMIYRLSLRIALFLLILAAIDFVYQRWSFEKSIRMTKEEVRQDMKQTEGNPQTKARIRTRQRMLAKRRMMSSIPLADVVLTNPTHFAVALKYDGATMVAPVLLAKGADLVAQRIRELAEEHNIPIVENPPLTRALYRQVDIGQEVPGEFYGAVAEVLAFVYNINKKQGYARA